MSGRFSILPPHAADDPELSTLELRVLIAIGCYLNRDNEAWPSQTTLAKRLGKTRESINRALRVLKDRGYLKIEHTTRADGGNGSAVYQVVLEPDVIRVFPRDAERHMEGVRDAERQEGCDVPASHAKELPNRTTSEAKASGDSADLFPDSKPKESQPAKVGDRPEEDPYKRLIFVGGLKLLTDQGMREPQARAFLGKLLGELGENGTVKLANAVTACQQAKPVDARSWLREAVKRRGGGPAAGPAPTVDDKAQEIDARFAAFARGERWRVHWGPRPDEPDADYPQELYDKHKLKRWATEDAS